MINPSHSTKSPDQRGFDIIIDPEVPRLTFQGDLSAKRRRPSIAMTYKRAAKTGRRVTSITTPDGYTIHFDETTPSDASNPWLADLPKVKQ